MKIQTQRSDPMRRLCKLIEGIPVVMLTTLDDEGRLQSRPMSPLEIDAGGAIWFFTDARSVSADQLGAMNIGFSDPSDSTYLSVSGRGELHTDRAAIERLWAEFAWPWFQDGVQSEHLALLKVIPAAAEYRDAPDRKMVRMLAGGASVMAREADRHE